MFKKCDVSVLSYPKRCPANIDSYLKERNLKNSLLQNRIFRRNSTGERDCFPFLFVALFDGVGFALSLLSECESESDRNRLSAFCTSALLYSFVFILCQFCVCECSFVCVGGGVGHLKFIYHIKEIISLVLPW